MNKNIKKNIRNLSDLIIPVAVYIIYSSLGQLPFDLITAGMEKWMRSFSNPFLMSTIPFANIIILWLLGKWLDKKSAKNWSFWLPIMNVLILIFLDIISQIFIVTNS